MKTFIVVLAAVALCAPSLEARADTVVTACASDVQTGAGKNLADALKGGGAVTFSCPANTVIRVTQGYILRADTSIDGGERVTLDGHGLRAVLLNSVATRVSLSRLTIRGFLQPPPKVVAPGAVGLGRVGGSVITARNATLEKVNIETSELPVVVRNALSVSDSAFSGNIATALWGEGETSVVRSRFIGNGSGLSISRGSVDDCSFVGQTNGALRIGAMRGPVRILHSTFSATRGDSAIVISQRSAASGSTTVTLRANLFEGNDGGAQAGAVRLFDVAEAALARGQSANVVRVLAGLPPGAFVLAYNRFLNNRGGNGGAAQFDLRNTTGMLSTGDLFVGNRAASGGGIVQSGGSLRMTHALFRDNRADVGQGAAILVQSGTLTLANALVVKNVGPAGALTGANLGLANVTIADNDAVGLVLVNPVGASAVNTILSGNRPGDCAGVTAGVFKGSNLQAAGSCPGVPTGEAFLDSMYVPAFGSPALELGDPKTCSAAPVAGSDLTFAGRGLRTCALGAFERAPLRHLPHTDRRPPAANSKEEFPDPDGLVPLLPWVPPLANPPSKSTSMGSP